MNVYDYKATFFRRKWLFVAKILVSDKGPVKTGPVTFF